MSLLTLFFITGCQSTINYSGHDNKRLPRKVAGACDENIAMMHDRFRKIGIKVVTIGQDYLISIPADILFANQSPRIRWGSYEVLNQVACYLKQYRKVQITVTGHVSKFISLERERSLSLARARAVGDYLEGQDIDSRLIFTDGVGSDKPIMKSTGSGDKSPNSRIEITFRRQVG